MNDLTRLAMTPIAFESILSEQEQAIPSPERRLHKTSQLAAAIHLPGTVALDETTLQEHAITSLQMEIENNLLSDTAAEIEQIFCNHFSSEEEQKEKIELLPPATINALLPKLNYKFLRFISDPQIIGLDYSKATGRNLQGIFLNNFISEEEKKRKVGLLPSSTINEILQNLDRYFLCFLSDLHILELDYPKLGREKLKEIFCSPYLTDQEKTAKIKKIPLEAIPQMIHQGFFEFLSYCSEEQLLQIDLQNMPQEAVSFLFPAIQPAQWHSELTHSVEVHSSGVTHTWRTEHPGRYSRNSETDECVIEKVAEREKLCLRNFQILSQQPQFAEIREKINPAVLKFLNQSRMNPLGTPT